MGAWLPVAGAAIFSIVVGIQGYVVADTAGERASEISAIDRASESRHRWDAAFTSGLPSAVKLSLHNASYFLGQNSAGVQWNYNSISSVDQRALKELNSTANADAQNKYSISAQGECSIPDTFSYRFNTLYTPDTDAQQLTALIRAQDARVECDFSGPKNVYEPEGEYSAKTKSLDNRYLLMIENLKQYHNKLSNRLSDVNSEYSASEDNICGYPPEWKIRDVESRAVSQAESDITTEFNFEPEFPPWLGTVERNILPNSDSLMHASTTIHKISSYETEITQQGCCESSPRLGCIAYYHDIDVSLFPGVVETEIRAEDTEYRIPVPRATQTSPESMGSGGGEWRNLQVFVQEYTQNIQND